MARYLVEHGANVNHSDASHNTPLHVAATCGHVDVVRYLAVDCRADIFIRNDSGLNVIEVAMEARKHEVMDCLFTERNLSGDTIFLSVRPKSLELVRYLVEVLRADVTISDEHGNSVLHHYASGRGAVRGSADIVSFLVEQGADPNARNNSGETPLHLACKHNQEHIVRHLIQVCHVDVNAIDVQGNTPLHTATSNKGYDVLECLIREGGADYTIRNANNRTACELSNPGWRREGGMVHTYNEMRRLTGEEELDPSGGRKRLPFMAPVPVPSRVTVAPSPAPPANPWTCDACTFVNPSSATHKCQMCDANKTPQQNVAAVEWACPSCTFVNQPASHHCDMCASARP
eukprot:TRINITY_DN3824_c0_g5_i1.p1 TRINITY_DN3824_c0_g5~~TRINITY_DN3824_c0_g5_i1.p1  ORF type:complete len:346 (-),score=48.70 TRINITY_DN3824_c0_g5_i1:131-1168(-)